MPDVVWTVIASVGVVVFGCFVFVIAFGAPFLPTHAPQVEVAFTLAKLKKGQTLLELGSGDGRILLAAAEQGINAIGYELNPLLVLYSLFRTRRYRKLVTIKWQNFWLAKLPESDAIFVFLLGRYMQKLDHKITNEAKKPQKLVSYAFTINGKTPVREKNAMRLYEYS